MKTIDSRYNFQADIVRSIAIIFVVVLHTIGPTISEYNSNIDIFGIILITLESITKVAVPLFIMLSGMLLLDRKKDYTSISEFYKKRISKIAIPIFFWILFYYVVSSLFTNTTIDILLFVKDVIFLDIFYHLYFLFIIGGLYFITPFLKTLLVKINNTEKSRLAFILYLYSACIIAINYIFPSRFNYWTILTIFIPFIPYYFLGEYISSLEISKKKYKLLLYLYVITIFITILLKFLAIYFNLDIKVLRYLSDALSINVIVLSMLSFVLIYKSKFLSNISNNPSFKKMLMIIAHFSFGIYIIHPIVIFLLNKILVSTGNSLITLIILFVKGTLTLFFSLLIVSIMSKIKYCKLLIGL